MSPVVFGYGLLVWLGT